MRGYFYIAAAGMCWASSAGLGKSVFSGRAILGIHPLPPLDPEILSQMRVTISLLVLAPLLLLFRGSKALAMSRGNALRGIVLGVLGLAASNFFYYYAIEKSSVSTAIIVQYTAPVWVLLFMVSRRLERATALRVLAVAAAVVGSALAIGIGQHNINLQWIGIITSLLAAFAFSFYNIYGRTLLVDQKIDRWKVIAWAFVGAALFWIVINPPWKIAAAHYSGAQWIFLVVFAFLSMLIPFSFYFSGLTHLDSTRAVVTSCLEPVFTILIAFAFLGESFRVLQAVGMAIVLLATIIVQLPAQGERRTCPVSAAGNSG